MWHTKHIFVHTFVLFCLVEGGHNGGGRLSSSRFRGSRESLQSGMTYTNRRGSNASIYNGNHPPKTITSHYVISLFLGVKTNAGSNAVQLKSDLGRKDFSHTKRWTKVRSATALALNKKSVVKKEGESIETRNKASGNKTRPASGEDKTKELPNLLASFNGAFCFFRLNKKRLIGSGNVFTSSSTHHHRNSHLLCSLLSLYPGKNL